MTVVRHGDGNDQGSGKRVHRTQLIGDRHHSAGVAAVHRVNGRGLLTVAGFIVQAKAFACRLGGTDSLELFLTEPVSPILPRVLRSALPAEA